MRAVSICYVFVPYLNVSVWCGTLDDSGVEHLTIVGFINKIKDCETSVKMTWIHHQHGWLQNGKTVPTVYDMS